MSWPGVPVPDVPPDSPLPGVPVPDVPSLPGSACPGCPVPDVLGVPDVLAPPLRKCLSRMSPLRMSPVARSACPGCPVPRMSAGCPAGCPGSLVRTGRNVYAVRMVKSMSNTANADISDRQSCPEQEPVEAPGMTKKNRGDHFGRPGVQWIRRTIQDCYGNARGGAGANSSTISTQDPTPSVNSRPFPLAFLPLVSTKSFTHRYSGTPFASRS